MKVLVLFFLSVISAVAQQLQANQLTFVANSPEKVGFINAQVIGTQGSQVYYYWVVAKFPIGNASPAGPAMVNRAPDTLTGSSFISVTWSGVNGATGYDVLRTTTRDLPSSGNIAVATNVTSTQFSNNTTTISAYVVNTASSASRTIRLDNQSFSAPRLVIGANTQVDQLCFTNGSCFTNISGVAFGTPLPATCTIGEVFFLTSATPGQNLYGCTSTNTWTLQSGGGGSITAVQAGTLGGILANTVAGVVSLDADPTFVMTQGGNNTPSGNMTPSTGTWNLTSLGAFRMKNGAADPATCTTSELFVNTSSTPVLKLCTATNTWTTIGSSSSAGTPENLWVNVSASTTCNGANQDFVYTIPAAVVAVGDSMDFRLALSPGPASGGSVSVLLNGTTIANRTTGGGEGLQIQGIISATTTTNSQWTQMHIRENGLVVATSGSAAATWASTNTFTVRMNCTGPDTYRVMPRLTLSRAVTRL